MGGNVFQGLKRYSKEEYNEIMNVILTHLKEEEFYKEEDFKIIPSFREKETFGDMDILIDSSKREEYLSFFKKLFIPHEISNNNHVVSLKVNEDFQLDLIFTNTEDMETSLHYFSFSDISNLIGRVFHKTGFKFSHRGLIFIVRVGNYVFQEIIVSKDWKKILEFLDYDYEVYSKGFDNLEDIFKFVASSPFFSPDIYLLHNRCHTSRVRDRKRKVYNEFLSWCKEKESILNHYHWESFDERGGYKEVEEWKEKAFLSFPGFKESYDNAKEKLFISRKVKEKFYGQKVSDITGLKGKELGNFISILKSGFHTIENFNTFILSLSEEELREWLMWNVEGIVSF